MAQTEALVVSISEKGSLVVQRNIAGIGTSAKAAQSSVSMLKGALATMGLVSVIAGLTIAVKQIASFGQEMSTVGAITGETGVVLEELRDKAKDLGITTRFSATQAAEGMTFLARAGFDTNEVLSAIGPTLQLAQAGALGLGEAADIASNVLTGFNIAATESARVIDILALAANSSNTNVQQLGEAMSYVAPISSSLGVSIEETAAAVEVLSNAGIQASRAGTNLTMVMRLMQSPTKKQQGVLNDLNLSTQDVNVSQVGLTGALTNMKKAGISTTQIFKFFGRSAAAAAVLLRGTNGAMQEFTEANKDAEGTAKGVAEAMDKNLNGALLATKSAFEGLILAFGDLGAESAFTQGFVNLASALRLVASNLDLLTKLLIPFGVAFAAIKYAAFLQGLSGMVTQFIALKQAVSAGTVVMLGSAQADVAKTAAALSGAKAELAQTVAMQASIKAKQANIVATNGLTVSSGFRINLMKQSTLLEAQRATQLNAVTAAQAKNNLATKAASIGSMSLSKALVAVRGGLAALALNPITIGLLAMSAAVAGLLIYFDKMKKMQEEIEAVETKIMKYQIDRMKVRVKEIQDAKAATQSIKDYLVELELENEIMQMSAPEKEKATVLTRALELAKRDLTEEEALSIEKLFAARDAIRAKMDVEKQELDLLAELKKPQEEFNARLALLTGLRDKDLLSLVDYNAEKKRMQEELGEKPEEDKSGEKFDAYLKGLTQENELLRMNSQEQEVQRAMLAARAQAGKDLLPGQKELVELAIAEKQAIELLNAEDERKRQLLDEIKGPELDQLQRKRDLNALLKEGAIDLGEFSAAMARVKEPVEEVVNATAGVAESLDSLWSTAANTIDTFVDGGIITFRGFTSAILGDISKIMSKILLMNALEGAGGLFDIGGFATGGSFVVGGSGGTDSQLVAFHATPGETVDVSTPAQQSAQNQSQQAPAGGLTIINLIDPDDIPAAMASAAGTDVLMNTVSLNKSSFKAALA